MAMASTVVGEGWIIVRELGGGAAVVGVGVPTALLCGVRSEKRDTRILRPVSRWWWTVHICRGEREGGGG
jgi:hypothetical protein